MMTLNFIKQFCNIQVIQYYPTHTGYNPTKKEKFRKYLLGQWPKNHENFFDNHEVCPKTLNILKKINSMMVFMPCVLLANINHSRKLRDQLPFP